MGKHQISARDEVLTRCWDHLLMRFKHHKVTDLWRDKIALHLASRDLGKDININSTETKYFEIKFVQNEVLRSDNRLLTNGIQPKTQTS